MKGTILQKRLKEFMKNVQFVLFLFLMLLCLYACNKSKDRMPDLPNPPMEEMPHIENDIDSILSKLKTNYKQLPEQEIAISKDGKMFAQYASPTDRYAHGIMGDAIEAAELVVVVDGTFYSLELDNNYVFEDIRPRLANVDEDVSLEIICIRSNLSKGAGIAIYKLNEDGLYEYAFVPEIGIRNRWLNIVAITNLDATDDIELAWIQTPHIGGILKIAKITEGKLQVVDQVSEYSNHAIGERNLCLSVVTLENEKKVIYVSSQDRNSITSFNFNNNKWEELQTINQAIDFSMPLVEQYDFSNVLLEEDNCINP